MLATAVMAMGQTSFKNVMCTELILDAKGFKMSKSRGNVIHPMDMFNKYGADPFRWVFYQSNPWTVKNFSQELLVETLRNVCIPLWNAFSFFVTYANIDGWEPSEDYVLSSNNCLDQWILSEFQTLNDTVQRALDDYDVATASAAIEKFIGLLTNWYIRRSRRRFWKSENDLDKDFAYHTLYYILLEFSKIISPFTPFISDRIYMNLTRDGKQDSVHLEDYPPIRPELHLPELEKKMNLVLETVALGRSLRNDSKLKIRQPLNQLILITPNWQEIENLTSIIAEELNLKHITLQKGDSGLVRKALKPNFSFLGPKFGSRTQEAVSLIAKFEPEQVEDFLSRGKIEVMGLALTAEDLVLEEKVAEGWAFKRGEMVSALLDTRLNDELINEGYAREFINKVQNLRKDREYNITDRINIKYSCDDRLESALSSHRDLIAREVLASSLKRITNGEGDILKINDKSAIVKIN
jgi:isoleucyl-tRNA synthetase